MTCTGGKDHAQACTGAKHVTCTPCHPTANEAAAECMAHGTLNAWHTAH